MTDTFTLPPEGMLSEQVDLPDYQLVLGLLHPPTANGLRVAAWDGERLRHLTLEAAVKWANDNDASRHAEVLKPVSDALRLLAKRVGEIEAAAIFARADKRVAANLAAMEAEGRA